MKCKHEVVRNAMWFCIWMTVASIVAMVGIFLFSDESNDRDGILLLNGILLLTVALTIGTVGTMSINTYFRKRFQWDFKITNLPASVDWKTRALLQPFVDEVLRKFAVGVKLIFDEENELLDGKVSAGIILAEDAMNRLRDL